MNKINLFFWKCAGVHQEILEKYPEEHSKYTAIGATIFFTGLFASLSGGYAMYFVFSGTSFAWLPAVLFGAVWGLAIFNMDRYIVLSINKSSGVFVQLLQALPRILLAVLIGLVISRPLELKIFDKEIRENLRVRYLADQRAKIDTLNATFNQKYATDIQQLHALTTERDSLESHIKEERTKLNYEIFGNKTTETSGVVGYGPYAKMKEEQLRKQELYLDSLRARTEKQQSLIKQKQAFEGLRDQKVLANASLDSAVSVAGFADRNTALGNLRYGADGKVNESNANAVTFISLLFVFLECLPVIVKLLAGRDAYDNAIQNLKTIHNYESDTEVDVEIRAIDKLNDTYIDAAINRRMRKINEE